MRKSAFAVIVLVMVSACSSIDCSINNIVLSVYQLAKGEGVADTLKADTLTIYTRRANGRDTILLNRSVNTSLFRLPMGQTSATDTLVFNLRDTFNAQLIDTIYISKENMPRFESVDCNIMFIHNVTGIRSTHNAIDTIKIVKTLVNNDSLQPNFHIYFKNRD